MEQMSFCYGLFLICSHEYMLMLGLKGKMIKKDNQVGPSWICHVVHGHVGSRTKEILRIR